MLGAPAAAAVAAAAPAPLKLSGWFWQSLHLQGAGAATVSARDSAVQAGEQGMPIVWRMSLQHCEWRQGHVLLHGAAALLSTTAARLGQAGSASWPPEV